MISLAFELSSAQGSLALFRGPELTAQKTWTSAARSQTELFRALTALLAEERVAVADIRRYLIGRGPGNFTGLRIACAAASAMALPGGDLVYAVSSGEALARTMARDGEREAREGSPQGNIVVLGDARRQTVWFGLLDPDDSAFGEMTFEAVPLAELADRIPAGAVVVSPDYDRLNAALPAAARAAGAWVEHVVFPTAEMVGRLALEKILAGRPSEPPLPIYIHPPVAVVKG